MLHVKPLTKFSELQKCASSVFVAIFEAMLQVLLERMQAQEDTMRQLHNKLADMQCSNMPLDNVTAQRISAVGAGCVKRSVSKEVSSHEAALAERPQGAVPREARAAPDDRARPPDANDFWT